jgi:hypothetical protein
MLDATLYTRALNLAIENGRSAVAHGDRERAEAFVDQFCHIVDYCHKQGLTLGSYSLAGSFRLKRSGMTPYALNIAIEGSDGWNYRTCAVDTRYAVGRDVRSSDDPTYGRFSL